ncbi:AraC family transcriptional regulator [Nocardia sp. NPDC050406]|uniref:AraC family transcriptional regulator n=1 Tax=Nocardia sp. NPDC050406 TaxID=3364318 RepID=UPI0037B0A2B2
MDPLADLLRAVKADGAVVHRAHAEPPWSFLNDEPAPLTVYSVLRGSVWLVLDEATRLDEGDVAVVRGPAVHTVADRPDRPPQVRIRHAHHCVGVADERPILDTPRLGPRVFGRSEASPLALITGAYRGVDDVGRRLLSVLPPLLVVRAEGLDSTRQLLTEELRNDGPGQHLVLDRLLDLILVRTLTNWFARPDATPPAWLRALADPAVGAALHAMHADPAHPWTVTTLAAKAGVSRAVFARRFTAAVGSSPLAYLTQWRMDLATQLLRESDATVAAVAKQVGYTDSFAFSTAFKRHRGVSPSRIRAAD